MGYYTDMKRSAWTGAIEVIAVTPSFSLLFAALEPSHKFLVVLGQSNKLRPTLLQLHRTLIQQFPQLIILHRQFLSSNDFLMRKGFVLPSKAVDFLKKSILFVGEMGNLIFVFAGKVDYLCFLFVVVLAEILNHLFFGVEDLLHTGAF